MEFSIQACLSWSKNSFNEQDFIEHILYHSGIRGGRKGCTTRQKVKYHSVARSVEPAQYTGTDAVQGCVVAQDLRKLLCLPLSPTPSRPVTLLAGREGMKGVKRERQSGLRASPG